MNTAIVPAVIKLNERPIIDNTHDDVEVALCVPHCGSLRTDAAGIYFDHANGKTYFWSAAAWQQVSADEANDWGQLVPTQPRPWYVIVRHGFAARYRRQLAAPHASRITHHDDRRLLP